MNTTSCVAAYLGAAPTDANAKVWAMTLELVEIAIKMGVSIERQDYGMIGNACHRKASDLEDAEIGLHTTEAEAEHAIRLWRKRGDQ